MKVQRRRLTIATAVAVAGGLSSAILFAAPASATPYTCGAGGTAIGGGICEITYTTNVTFTPPSNTTKLEALLVGGGGASGGYGYAGGGGAVSVENFTDTTDPIDISVGSGSNAFDDNATASTATQGATVFTALAGHSANGADGGTSGSGKLGWQTSQWVNDDFASAGGGAGASPTKTQDGGAGVVVSSIAGSGSLFANDHNCYGGGGAVLDWLGNYGTATCGGGYIGKTDVVPAVANSGGGGASVSENDSAPNDTNLNYLDSNPGAAGVIVFRWEASDVSTLSFVMNGHGTQVPEQFLVTNTAGTDPTPPAGAHVKFLGWFTDPTFSTPYDFSTPVNGNVIVYAEWAALAETGVDVNPWVVPGSVGLLALGAAFVGLSRRRRARA